MGKDDYLAYLAWLVEDSYAKMVKAYISDYSAAGGDGNPCGGQNAKDLKALEDMIKGELFRLGREGLEPTDRDQYFPIPWGPPLLRPFDDTVIRS